MSRSWFIVVECSPMEPRQVQFRLDCDPPKATHHAKKIVRRGSKGLRLADSDKLVEARALLEGLVLQAKLKHRVKPFEGSVRLRIKFTFRPPKKREANPAEYHFVKPDLTNLAKTIEDVLVRQGIIKDDCWVAQLALEKTEQGRPGIDISIIQLEPGGENL